MQTTTRALVRLSDADIALSRPEEDIRGLTIVDRNTEEMGTVDDLFVDPGTGKVRFLLAGQGGILGLGKKQYLIPVDAVTSVEGDRVQVNKLASQMEGAPEYDPSREPDWEPAYTFWAVTPFWMSDYREPADWSTRRAAR